MRILLIGEQPESVDFKDPALPPGLSAEKIHAGLDKAMKDMAARGWQGELLLIQPDDSAGPQVAERLASQVYECVVIGGGIRVPPKRLAVFEAVINAVHKAAPTAVIGFNTSPEDTPDAAARALDRSLV